MRRVVVPLVLVIIAFLVLPASAEIFRWTDAEGRVHFSDRAPAEVNSEVKRVKALPAMEGKAGGTSVAESSPAGDKADASARSYPRVEIYTTKSCGWCRKALAFLQEKGVPYTEYDVQNDSAAYRRFQELNPRGGVPLAIIGDEKLLGFSQADYSRALGLQ